MFPVEEKGVEEKGRRPSKKRGGVEASDYWRSGGTAVMPSHRPDARKAPGGIIFHCLNRGNDRREIFDDAGDLCRV
jgi:hypothetical protein